ncbi:acyl-CoA dehydrogenase family protein [Chloroflexota bacterium]
MDFELSEEQKMLQKTIRDFAEKETAPIVDAAEAKGEPPRELFQRMGQLGFLSVGTPEKYGGGGMGLTGVCIFKEEMSRVCAGIAQSSIMLTPHWIDLATEMQREKYFLPLIRGEKLASFGLTEPNAGSDAVSVKMTAKKDGDSYVLNGEKIFTTSGTIADFMIALAVTDDTKGHRGMSAFIVDKDAPGLTTNKLHKFGMQSADTGQEFFDNCRIPAQNLLGEEGKGFYYFMDALDYFRPQYAAQCVGIAQVAYENSVSYAKERIQFGQPIGKFQVNAFKLVEMDTDIETARLLIYKAAWLADQERPYAKEAAASRYLAADVAMHVTTEALQIHGGYGLVSESPLNRHFRDAKFFSIMMGTSEICKVVIARTITG